LRKSILTKISRTCIKHVLVITNIALILVLLLQGFFVFLETCDYEVPIPNFLFKKIEKELGARGIHIKTGERHFRLDGELNIEDLSLYYRSGQEPMVTSERVRCKLGLFALLFGKVKLKDIEINDGTFYCPAAISPTGIHEPIIQDFYIWASTRGKMVYINEIFFNLYGNRVLLQGGIKKSFLRNTEFGLGTKGLFETLRKIIKEKDFFTHFENPILIANIDQDSVKEPLIDIAYDFDAYKNDRFSLGQGTLTALFNIDNKGLEIKKPAQLSFSMLEWENRIRVKQGFARINVDLEKAINLELPTTHVDFDLIEIKSIYENLDTVMGDVALDSLPWIKASIGSVKDQEWAKLDIWGDTEERNAIILGCGSINTTTLNRWQKKLEAEDAFTSDIGGDLEFSSKAQISFVDNLAVNEVEGTLSSSDFILDNIPLTSLHGNIYYKRGEQIRIEDIYLRNEANIVEGFFLKDLKDENYRLLAQGSIEPEVLNPWMKSWWENLWEKIDLRGEMPWTNIDIYAQNEEVEVYGEIYAKDFSYQQVPFDDCTLRINSGNHYLEFADIKGRSSRNTLNAYLKWDYESEQRQKVLKTTLDVRSKFPLRYLGLIAGKPKVDELIQDFSCREAPLITLQGTLYDNEYDDDLNIEFATSAPLYYKQAPLDYLSFNIMYRYLQNQISDIRLGFAQGYATGNIFLERQSRNRFRATYEGSLSNASMDIALNHIQQMRGTMGTNKPLRPDVYGGVVDLNIRGEGILGQKETHIGNGNIRVSKAHLGKINLFGILSQVLSLTPLGLGSFQLTDVSGDFQMHDNKLFFPELNIYGPSANIVAKGNYTMGTGNLDFGLRISPMNKKGAPILSQAFLLLAPITQSFEVELEGTLDDPKWKTNITPFGLFKGKQKKTH